MAGSDLFTGTLELLILKALSWVGLVWDLRKPSDEVRNAYLKYSDEVRAELRSERVGFNLGRRPATPEAAAAKMPLPVLEG